MVKSDLYPVWQFIANCKVCLIIFPVYNLWVLYYLYLLKNIYIHVRLSNNNNSWIFLGIFSFSIHIGCSLYLPNVLSSTEGKFVM